MSNKEKFEAFKKDLIQENEEKYGQEVREKYGEKTVEESNRKMLKMTEEEYERFTGLEKEVRESLEKAVEAGISPNSEEGKRIMELHKEWLTMTWPTYSAQAHKGLAVMYVADERFTAYYDRRVSGCAAFLQAAIEQFA